jgi:glycosyltransferase involved in cell wall biosynthesis
MEKKKKILFISDHQLSTSGVATQARYLIHGLLSTGRYTFRCLGAAIKHEKYDPVFVNEDFIIQPVDNFGDPNIIRRLLVTEKPDAVFIFNDPRFFYHLWEIEDEIHQICPIVYWHLWDNVPVPTFNKIFYECTDLINCINWPTYSFVSNWFPDKTNYVPHAVPNEVFFPMKKEDVLPYRNKLLKSDSEHFVALYVGRNARRKMVPDMLTAWSMFLQDLKSKHLHDNARLILHTDPTDQEGSNLFEVINMLGIQKSVIFSNDKLEFTNMNILYNVADVQLNYSCAEGFGLPTLEGGMCGLPMIAMKTGGLTRQVEDHMTGQQYGVALEPEVKCLSGNQIIPFIYDDYVSHSTYSQALMKMYDLWTDKQAYQTLRSDVIKHVNRDYVLKDTITAWDKTMQETFDKWEKDKCGYVPWSLHTL